MSPGGGQRAGSSWGRSSSFRREMRTYGEGEKEEREKGSVLLTRVVASPSRLRDLSERHVPNHREEAFPVPMIWSAL